MIDWKKKSWIKLHFQFQMVTINYLKFSIIWIEFINMQKWQKKIVNSSIVSDWFLPSKILEFKKIQYSNLMTIKNAGLFSMSVWNLKTFSNFRFKTSIIYNIQLFHLMWYKNVELKFELIWYKKNWIEIKRLFIAKTQILKHPLLLTLARDKPNLVLHLNFGLSNSGQRRISRA